MYTQISLEKIDGKIKVVTFQTDEFIAMAHILHGKQRENAWWFDDSAIDAIREVLLKEWNTTGETPYEECQLMIHNYTRSALRGPVWLFNRVIAEAKGLYKKPVLGQNIWLIHGTCKTGGTSKFWETRVVNATFQLQNFPAPAIELPDVKKAMKEGWCAVTGLSKERTEQMIKAEIQACEFRWSELQNELDSLKKKDLKTA